MDHPLPQIGKSFFDEFAKGDPVAALALWNQWLNNRQRRVDDDARYRKALEICVELGGASIRHYLSRRHQFLSESNLDLLDRISHGLNQKPPRRVMLPAGAIARPRRCHRLALLSQLDVPSEGYHMQLIRGIVRAAQLHNLAVSLHEVSPIDLASSIDRVRTNFRPDGLVMLRMTPTPRDLEPLSSNNIPLVLVHADRFIYPWPVLANIVPKQNLLAADLRAWAETSNPGPKPTREAKRTKAKKAVVVAVQRETPTVAYPTMAGINPSIRNDRIDQVGIALRQFRVEYVWVDGYGFQQAMGVYRRHPDADLYVSLSDEIAVGLKHILIAAKRPWEGRIVGFDDSPMSREEGLPSFSQSLDAVGSRVVGKLQEFFIASPDSIPANFEELAVDVHLEMRY